MNQNTIAALVAFFADMPAADRIIVSINTILQIGCIAAIGLVAYKEIKGA